MVNALIWIAVKLFHSSRNTMTIEKPEHWLFLFVFKYLEKKEHV